MADVAAPVAMLMAAGLLVNELRRRCLPDAEREAEENGTTKYSAQSL